MTITSEETTKRLETVRKLLAKADDPACSANEREAIMDKVTQLMVTYSIEQAMLDSSDKDKRDEKPTNVQFKFKAPYVGENMLILSGLARVFGCKAIRVGDNFMRIFGFNSDIERVYLLYASLSLQMMTALQQAQADKPKYVHGKTYNSNFVKGFAREVVAKVSLAYTKAKNEARNSSTGSGMDIVLADRKQLVDMALNEAFPHTKPITLSGKPNGYEGYTQGKAAGARADVGSSRIGSSRREIGR